MRLGIGRRKTDSNVLSGLDNEACAMRLRQFGVFWCVLAASFVIPTCCDAAPFVDVYKMVKPAVVLIVSAFPDGAAYGSGFVLKSDATTTTIVTANHVVEGATNIDVILDSDLKKRYPATIVNRDHLKDVAVIEIAVGNRKTLSLASAAQIEEGMTIAVAGYPRASGSFEQLVGDSLRPTVHEGIVSAIRLDGDIIQFDAVTDHGNSGGPVFDSGSGKVVAIVRGAPLDPTYAAQGLEQALPGSFYGPSSATIASVLAEATRPSSAAATPNPNGNSAAYRVGMINASSADPMTQEIGQAIFGRLNSDLETDNSFYLIPVSLTGAEATSEQLLGFCQDNRLNAIMYPRYQWTLTGGEHYSLYGPYYTGRADVEVDLAVTDCAGDPIYIGKKEKSESRYAVNHPPDREISDMANDLVDQLFKDYNTYRAAHQGAWDTLLKYGLAINPVDDQYHAMFYPVLEKNGDWQIYGVFPGGPADQAGLKSRDVIVSINGTSVSGLNSDQISSLLNVAEYSIVVQRPGGDVTLTVHAEKYDELISSLTH
jgi:S1-C subfamily serine protease